MNETVLYIDIANESYPYTLMREKNRNTKLLVDEEGAIWVYASLAMPISEIEDFLRKHSRFIIKHTSIANIHKAQALPPPVYEDGDRFYFMDQILTLKLIPTMTGVIEERMMIDEQEIEAEISGVDEKGEKEREGKKGGFVKEQIGLMEYVEADDIYLYVYLRNTGNLARKKRLIRAWYDEQTLQVLQEMIQNVYQMYVNHGYKVPKPEHVLDYVRKWKSKWGHCTPKSGKIALNSYLIFQPKRSVEYVVIHEYAHFIHVNHTKEFWSVVEEIMPDYKMWEAKLVSQRNMEL